MSHRLGILASHPIQYQAPWFRYLAKRMDIEVFYAHRQDAKGQAAAGFGVEFEWDIPLLEGYPYRWLKNVARRPGLTSFFGCDTSEIYDLVRGGHFDAFLVLGWNRKSFIQAIRACWKKGVPVLVRGDSNLAQDHFFLKSAVKHFPYRWFLRRFDAHLYVGKRNRDYLAHYGVPENRLFFSPHFVDNEFFGRKAEPAEKNGESLAVREKFGIPKDAFVFLFVGKMIPKKRPADFIQACLSLFGLANNKDAHALLVGEGPLRESLGRLAGPFSGKIHFAGFRNQSELPAFYRASNALVLPSDGRETWGLVVNEAFASGIPAILSDEVGCAPDLIEEGETGYLFPLGDIKRLTGCMLELQSLGNGRFGRIREALARKISRYSIEQATEGLLEAMETVT